MELDGLDPTLKASLLRAPCFANLLQVRGKQMWQGRKISWEMAFLPKKALRAWPVKICLKLLSRCF